MSFELALITVCGRWGIVSIALCNVTTFISIQSCINFLQWCCIHDGRVGPLCKVFSCTSKRPSVRVKDMVVAKNDSHCGCDSQFELGRTWCCLYGICPCHQERKQSTLWELFVIQYIQVISHEFEPRLDQLKQPQVITLPSEVMGEGR